jgi:hypothetical protein
MTTRNHLHVATSPSTTTTNDPYSFPYKLFPPPTHQCEAQKHSILADMKIIGITTAIAPHCHNDDDEEGQSSRRTRLHVFFSFFFALLLTLSTFRVSTCTIQTGTPHVQDGITRTTTIDNRHHHLHVATSPPTNTTKYYYQVKTARSVSFTPTPISTSTSVPTTLSGMSTTTNVNVASNYLLLRLL